MNEFGQQKTDNDQFAECMKNSFAETGVAPQYNTPAWKACQYVWEKAYSAGVQDERERCAVKDTQIKILWSALETIIDITHCTCAQYRQDPALLCPTCTAISAIDSMERIGALPDSALPQR